MSDYQPILQYFAHPWGNTAISMLAVAILVPRCLTWCLAASIGAVIVGVVHILLGYVLKLDMTILMLVECLLWAALAWFFRQPIRYSIEMKTRKMREELPEDHPFRNIELPLEYEDRMAAQAQGIFYPPPSAKKKSPVHIPPTENALGYEKPEETQALPAPSEETSQNETPLEVLENSMEKSDLSIEDQTDKKAVSEVYSEKKIELSEEVTDVEIKQKS